jgi:hypothetical protein
MAATLRADEKRLHDRIQDPGREAHNRWESLRRTSGAARRTHHIRDEVFAGSEVVSSACRRPVGRIA